MTDQELEQVAGALFAAAAPASLAASQSSRRVGLIVRHSPPDHALPAERVAVFSVTSALALDEPAWRSLLDQPQRTFRMHIETGFPGVGTNLG
jgi:hypothetical protein